MKRQIKKIALLIIAILGVNCANAQTDFSIHLGLLFPQGDFAESRMDKGQVAWGYKTDRAGAGLGFDAGLKFRFNVPSVKGLGFITTADFFLNMPNDDVKDWKEDYISEMEEYSGVDEFSIAIPHYINIPIMVGLNYEYEIKDNIKFWGEGALGLNIGALTNYKQSIIGDDFEIVCWDVVSTPSTPGAYITMDDTIPQQWTESKAEITPKLKLFEKLEKFNGWLND